MHRRLCQLACAVIVLTLFAGLTAASVAADAPDPAFQATWARTDKPVAGGAVARTWMWGPQANTPAIPEPYAESPDGTRTVQYFDKARMEITHPESDPSSIWHVTNGLLVVEMLTGRMQVGDKAFVPREPAAINVAGDANDLDGPTYATFAGLTGAAPAADGAKLTQRLDRAGHVTNDAGLAQHGVTAAQHVQVPGIDHQIAAPFWAFMNSSGLVYQDGGNTTAKLFVDPFYATGYPLTEAYWASVRIGGTARDVLVQCFERRCLTYTPGNPAGFETEAGNVGQHYHAWRYESAGNGGGGGDTQQLQVVNVIDGNQIVVRANGFDFSVRYLGIQDPEGSECYAAEATQRNRELVLGQVITIVRDITNTDWYGTLPRYVYVGDTFINLELVREGYARAIDVKNDQNIAHKAELLAAQAEAQAAGRGLWGACG